MKFNRKKNIIILIILGNCFSFLPIITISFSFFANNSTKSSVFNENLKISEISGKIHINNNWTAAKAAGICTGSGTYSEPYIIEDLVINGGRSGSCILIENSNVFFRIENCTVYYSGANWGDGGIELYNVDNGQLINNYVYGNYEGIILYFCNTTNISDNTVNINTYVGIGLWYSENNTISKNTFKYNGWGISLESSNNNNITGNMVRSNYDDGMGVWNSFNNVISGNKLVNNYRGCFLYHSYCNIIELNTINNHIIGILLEGGNSNLVLNNTFNGNSFNIKDNQGDLIHIIGNSGWSIAKIAGTCIGNGTYSSPYVIKFLVIEGGWSESCILIENSDVYFRIENCTIYNSSMGIQLTNVLNAQLIDNNCSSNFIGICIGDSNNNTISGNRVNQNDYYGIYLFSSSEITISGNTANFNMYSGILLENCVGTNITGNKVNFNDFYDWSMGIYLFFSYDTIVSGNTVSNNRYGIHLYNSDNNIIRFNIIEENDFGIYLKLSYSNEISNNTFNGNNVDIKEYDEPRSRFGLNELFFFIIILLLISSGISFISIFFTRKRTVNKS